MLGFLAFYNSFALAFGAVLVIILVYQFTNYYSIDMYGYYLDSFIDFLNQINSGLSSGMSFDASLVQSKRELEGVSSYMKQIIDRLNNALALGLNGDALYDELESAYPISDSMLYVNMMRLGKRTGASMNRITEVTLSSLYTRFRTVSEAKLIIYQKQMEQMILCISPLLVIFFIRMTSSEFLLPLYTTGTGVIVMTFSFTLLVLMKLIGRKIVGAIK